MGKDVFVHSIVAPLLSVLLANQMNLNDYLFLPIWAGISYLYYLVSKQDDN